MMDEFECKKCGKSIELPLGLLQDNNLVDIMVFLKHHKKHGVFVISEDEPIGYIKVRNKGVL